MSLGVVVHPSSIQGNFFYLLPPKIIESYFEIIYWDNSSSIYKPGQSFGSSINV